MKLHVIFLFVLYLTACEQPPPQPVESPSDKMASAVCGCTAKLLDLNQRSQTAADSLAFRQIEAEFVKTKACVAALEIKKEERAAIESSLGVKCPVLAANKDLLKELLGQ